MLPYLELPPIDLDGLGLGKLYWFAIFVVAGIVLGVIFYDRMTARGGAIDPKIARLLPEAAVIGGFIGAHLVHVLVYHPELMDQDRWVLLKFWGGISSIGGFFGGAIAVIGVLVYYKQPAWLPYGDRLMLALTVGWVFGRLGCATSHDHPGAKTDFFLAVAYPGGARHDLGVYEFLFTLLWLLPLLLWIAHKPWRTGSIMAAVFLSYAPVRFLLDFLRATDREFVDRRFLGLTPAQYGCLVVFAAGGVMLWRAWRSTDALQPPMWGPQAAPIKKK